MYGVVPAAGREMRLRPATDDRPKALVEVGEVIDLVEKPGDPPSRLATTGCFAFSTRVFEACRAVDRSERREYELVGAVRWPLEGGGTVEAVRFDARRVNVNASGDVERAEVLL